MVVTTGVVQRTAVGGSGGGREAAEVSGIGGWNKLLGFLPGEVFPRNFEDG